MWIYIKFYKLYKTLKITPALHRFTPVYTGKKLASNKFGAEMRALGYERTQIRSGSHKGERIYQKMNQYEPV